MAKIQPFNDAGGFTTFDNAILDYIMPSCKPNTWKVVCATLRKTIGWEDQQNGGRKELDQISISQYQEMTGIVGRSTMITAIEDALKEGYLIRFPDGQSYKYGLNRGYEIETSPKIVPVPKQDQSQSQNRTSTSPKIVHTKERKETKENKSRKRDKRLDHPAIIAYREVARLHVPITWRDKVIEVVDDAARWTELVRDWIGYGWNKQNVKGMLEAYERGGINRKNGKNEPNGFAGIREYMESEGMSFGD